MLALAAAFDAYLATGLAYHDHDHDPDVTDNAMNCLNLMISNSISISTSIRSTTTVLSYNGHDHDVSTSSNIRNIRS
eukprot:1750955-Heterocapsa_arctica.AAC.1